MLHPQRKAADGPLEALEVGDQAAVAEIANFLLALVDLELLPVELLLQIPNLKLQTACRSLEAAMLDQLPELDARRKRSCIPPLGYRLL